MQYRVLTMTFIISAFTLPMTFPVTFYETVQYSIVEKSVWVCPNGTKFDTLAAATQACGPDAKLTTETITTGGTPTVTTEGTTTTTPGIVPTIPTGVLPTITTKVSPA